MQREATRQEAQQQREAGHAQVEEEKEVAKQAAAAHALEEEEQEVAQQAAAAQASQAKLHSAMGLSIGWKPSDQTTGPVHSKKRGREVLVFLFHACQRSPASLNTAAVGRT